MTPEWSYFKVLLALARAGSVAGAARELEVDHSTISRRLAALEESVGAQLLIRGGREFSWTAEGRTLLDAAETMEAAAAKALRDVRTAKLDVEGAVRVSVSPAFVPLLIRLMVPALRATHPLLRVELSGAYEIADLARGEADIAVRMDRPAQPDLIARRAFDCGWCLYAATTYLKSHGHPANFAELAEHQLVLYVESMHRIAPLRWMETYRGPTQVVSRVDNIEIACQSASSGGGIAVLPAFIGDAVTELQRVFQERVSVNTGWIVYHEALRDASRIRVVSDALLEFFHAHSGMFSGSAP